MGCGAGATVAVVALVWVVAVTVDVAGVSLFLQPPWRGQCLAPGVIRERGDAAPLVPSRPTLKKLRIAAAGCQACDLWRTGTQTVFGEGKQTSTVMFVGEQPGNQEDLRGKPFVGPAGALLDKALVEAGIDRNEVYVTNVVKHFKWEPRGKRRIHKKPNASEIKACRPWLDAEINVIKPRVIVCLGSTAAQAILGPKFKVSAMRATFVPSPLAPFVTATVHPSSILRAPSHDQRRAEMAKFIADLKKIRKAIDSEPAMAAARRR